MCTDVLENAHCERANGIIKNEYLKRWHIPNFERLKQLVPKAVENYNNRRHNSIGMTPNQYETYIKELDEDKRVILEVFTKNILFEKSAQLTLNFSS